MSPFATVDYWQVLGLEPGADPASLKRAFRQQARRWHPDLNGNDPVAEERFKQVNEAYAVLSDPRRRRAWEAGEDPADQAAVDADPFASGFPPFEDYLERLFGEVPRAQRPAPEREAPARDEEPLEREPVRERAGDVTASPPPPPPVPAASDEETTVLLTPEQAVAGTRVELTLRDGTVVEVWTPPLAGDGWRLRLAGVAPGGGDHFLQLRVRTPEGLRVDGLRVHYLLEIAPAEAALGCQRVVPTLEGPVRLRVPAGSSSGRLLRLRERGMTAGDRRGDQLVEVRIVVPDELDGAREALYRRLRELDNEQQEDRADDG
ncbi:DnaJ domain-containing protein [Cyanobium sp. FGCU-52]|nr:DnaJ domain-containing protein [Cyanobium sp. FGCU52]